MKKTHLTLAVLTLVLAVGIPVAKLAANAPSTAPSASLVDTALAGDVLANLRQMETIQRLKGESGIAVTGAPKVVATRIVSRPDTSGAWVEEWTLQRETGKATYTVLLTPGPDGRTSLGILPPATSQD